MCVCASICVCVSVCVCVCASIWVCVRERERECVYVCRGTRPQAQWSAAAQSAGQRTATSGWRTAALLEREEDEEDEEDRRNTSSNHP